MACLARLHDLGMRIHFFPVNITKRLLKSSTIGKSPSESPKCHYYTLRTIPTVRSHLNGGHVLFPQILATVVLRRTKYGFNRKDPKELLREQNRKTKEMNAFVAKFQHDKTSRERSNTTMVYLVSLVILTVGASYAAVPLYRIFCQQSGYGGTVQTGHDTEKVEAMKPKKDRKLTVKFQADTAAAMQWNFRPQQNSVTLYAGETALAFYTAKNPTSKPIDGISTYNVIPFEAGAYFNKIQCFCFEEQRLNPNEEVDMPVFFYIDPDYLDDPFLEDTDEIYLSYTFFESKPGMKLPMPM